jgi:small subunit ribosomal protein S6
MRLYETTFLIAPTLPEEEAEQLIEKMAGIVSEKKGKMINVDKWGKRRLAYPITKFEDAVYVFFLYKGDVDIPMELERNFKQTEAVIRYLTIKMEERENIRRTKKKASRTAETSREAPRAEEKAKEETVVEEKPVEAPPEKKPENDAAVEEKKEEKKEKKKDEVKIPAKKKEETKDAAPNKKGKDTGTKKKEAAPEKKEAAVKEEKEE